MRDRVRGARKDGGERVERTEGMRLERSSRPDIRVTVPYTLFHLSL